jgi:hypothetical protein
MYKVSEITVGKSIKEELDNPVMVFIEILVSNNYAAYFY